MADTPEGKVVEKIQKWLLDYEGDCFKVHGNMYQRSGEPDLTGSIKWYGHWLHFKLEVKAPKGESSRKTSTLQKVRMRKWHKCAKVVGVVRSVGDVVEILNTYKNYIEDEMTTSFSVYAETFCGLVDEHNLYGEDAWEH